MKSKLLKRSKVAIIYGPGIDFDEVSFKYYILQLNKLQSVYELSFPAVDDELFTGVDPGKDDLFDVFKKARIQEAKDVDEDEEEQVYIEEGDPEFFIIIVGTAIRDALFADWRDDTALVTTDRWDKDYSPPSVYEYLLNSICALLILMDKPIGLDTHMATRGCALDYTAFKDDTKIDAALGYLCDECKEKIVAAKGPDFLNEFNKMINRAWVGNIDDADSVAYNLKRYFRFNIDKDSGFNKTFWERTKDHLTEVPEKILFVLISGVIGAILGTLFSPKR
jgi:hypothetical protein